MNIKTLGYLMEDHTLGALVPARTKRSNQRNAADWKSHWECKAGEILLQNIRERGGTITLDRPPQYVIALLERLEAQHKIERVQGEGLIDRVANAAVFTYQLA